MKAAKIGVSAAQASVDFHGPTEDGEIKHKRLANTEIQYYPLVIKHGNGIKSPIDP